MYVYIYIYIYTHVYIYRDILIDRFMILSIGSTARASAAARNYRPSPFIKIEK